MKQPRFLLLGLLLWSAAAQAAPETSKITVEQPLIFTSQTASVRLADEFAAATEISYTLKSLSREGQWTEREARRAVKDGVLQIQPLREGLHVAALKIPQSTIPLEARFLAITPPAPLSTEEKKVLRQTLPRAAGKLLSGQPVTLLAAGDSVTATGDYPQILAMMLARATGNAHIRAVKKAYAGKSVDATVRHWRRDLDSLQKEGARPDIGLVMYGLNDQIAGVPLEAYLEQCEWVADRLNEIGADAVFLQPTPHIDIAPWGQENAQFPLRTLGFGAALAPVANRLKVPVVPTWRALWGKGGNSLETSARSLWPVYPPSYNRQFETLSPEGGTGDTIHPNALGHLQMARAVFKTLTAKRESSPLSISGVTSWTKDGITSSLSVRNDTNQRRRGRLEAVPPTGVKYLAEPLTYDLAPGETKQFAVQWQGVTRPQDLLEYPFDRYLLTSRPLVPVMDFSSGGSTPYVAAAPFDIEANWQRERWNGVRDAVDIQLRHNRDASQRRFRIPDQPVGRFPITHHVQEGGRKNWAVGELAFVRYGAALSGEAEIDGDLSEWSTGEKLWVPVGEKIQARWSKGIEDNRATPQESFTHWAFRAGAKGMYFACRATGDVARDSFTIYFDPRSPHELGTAGPYFWLSGDRNKDGSFKVQKGETSDIAPGLKGTWRAVENGANIEIFVPYELMESTAWPQPGDLGVSIVWAHVSPDQKVTRLMWSENGHPWNTRWYGVVRRLQSPEQADTLPFMVRVR